MKRGTAGAVAALAGPLPKMSYASRAVKPGVGAVGARRGSADFLGWFFSPARKVLLDALRQSCQKDPYLAQYVCLVAQK